MGPFTIPNGGQGGFRLTGSGTHPVFAGVFCAAIPFDGRLESAHESRSDPSFVTTD